jgi:8-oxo-dGTP pyrophosphatase MutT (NUDIX family)
MLPADLAENLALRLQCALPGAAAQRDMEPELAFGRHAHTPPADAREAAVVIALFLRDGAWHVPLVLRPQTMKDHAGQIGLPGGAVEPGEESSTAALRELREELGIEPEEVRVLGALSPIWVFASNFAVTPWVAEAAHCAPRPQPDEVAELLEVPLAGLLDPGNRSTCRQRRGPLEFSAPCFLWDSHIIWGATAIILNELLEVVKEPKS